MRKIDIKKLEHAVRYYEQVERCLGAAVDSLEKQPTEYFTYYGITMTTLVNDMLKEAIHNRKYLEGKVKVLKEEFLNK